MNTEAEGTNITANFPDTIICFSHLRWDFVYQRPQHILSRMAQRAMVYYIEEPVIDSDSTYYSFTRKQDQLIVVVPHLPVNSNPAEHTGLLEWLLDDLLAAIDMTTTAFWYYTPMALRFSRQHNPMLTVFDCMDELSAFRYAPQDLKDLEEELLARASIVFTGGASLFAAKKDRHQNIHLFPSSIEKEHFGSARNRPIEMPDQEEIPHPRLGFFGVIDERFDIDLIRDLAALRPEWQLILVGPVVKIDPGTLPQAANIHYLGSKQYSRLPAYLSGWDIALIPFARNESTRFISPTKTPEYLAAGIPVISTPLMDVIEPYGTLNLVHIAADATEFAAEAEQIFQSEPDKKTWLSKVDFFLKDVSWDHTCGQMQQLMSQTIKPISNQQSEKATS